MMPPASASSRIAPTVQADSFVTLHYRLCGPAGDFLNTFGGQPATLSLGAGQLAPAVEQCLIGLHEGARAHFDLEPGVAFGPRNAALLQWIGAALMRELHPHDGAPAHYRPGDLVQFPTPDGSPGCAAAVVQMRDDGAVLFDFNHPLAGHGVRFEVHIIAVL